MELDENLMAVQMSEPCCSLGEINELGRNFILGNNFQNLPGHPGSIIPAEVPLPSSKLFIRDVDWIQMDMI